MSRLVAGWILLGVPLLAVTVLAVVSLVAAVSAAIDGDVAARVLLAVFGGITSAGIGGNLILGARRRLGGTR